MNTRRGIRSRHRRGSTNCSVAWPRHCPSGLIGTIREAKRAIGPEDTGDADYGRLLERAERGWPIRNKRVPPQPGAAFGYAGLQIEALARAAKTEIGLFAKGRREFGGFFFQAASF